MDYSPARAPKTAPHRHCGALPARSETLLRATHTVDDMLNRHSGERRNDTRAPRQLASIRPHGRRSAGHTDIQKEKPVL